jgi:hypothetical protein
MKAVIEVTDCRDCPFAHDHRGHGECWKECTHPQHNQGAYGNVLWGCQAKFTATPDWCPLKAWVGLTDMERQMTINKHEGVAWETAIAIEQQLKEKNV